MKTKLHALIVRYMSSMGMRLHALPLTADSLDAIPEAHRGLYVEKDGKHHLDVSGVEDTSGLKTALEKERANNKAAKAAQEAAVAAALKQYEGIDPVKTREMMAKLGTDEEQALIAAGKFDEVITKRMAKHTDAQQQLLDEAKEREEGAMEVASTFMERVLDNHIRAAASKAGIHPGAIEDALLRARNLFSLDDDGNAVQFDEDGETVVLGKDGKTPFTPEEWLEAMKDSAPHWFPAGASGSGAGGSRQGQGGGKTMKRAAFEALDPIARASAMKEKIALTD